MGLDPGAIDLDSPLTELGQDSLDVVELFMELEEEFEANIPDAVAENIRTVRELIEWLVRGMQRPPQED